MSRPMSLEALGTILDELSGTGRTDYVAVIVDRTATIRQQPAWRIPGNWLPRFLATASDPVELAPRRRSAILIATTLLLLAALVAAAIAGSRPPLPRPFGPAGNGQVIFVRDGDIYVGDSIESTPRLLIGGPDHDGIPLFSLLGDRLAFVREPSVQTGDLTLMLANADGSGIRPWSDSITGLNGVAWSPNNTDLVFGQSIESVSALVLYTVDGRQPKVLDVGVPAEWPAWRPPDGGQLAFVGLVEGQWRLHTARADGARVRDLGLAASFPSWSPDGSRLVFADSGEIYVAKIDELGGLNAVHRLEFDPRNEIETGAVWSPDGRRLAFVRGRNGLFSVAVGNADGTGYRDVGIETGPRDQSVTSVWAWSPDGQSILQTFDDGPTWLLDPDGGAPRQAAFGVGGFSNWQRIAP
jgi:Tol biopolymer transport system component